MLEVFAGLVLGCLAGFTNTVVGSGSLLTYPFLLGLGLNPLTANVTNTVAMTPGSFFATVGYRRLLGPLGRRACTRFAIIAVSGSLAGGALLLMLPVRVFNAVVPFVIVGATVLMLVDSALRRKARAASHHRGGLYGALFPASLYGGYFGAAQGVILIAILNSFSGLTLQEANAVKNLMTFMANVTAALLFVIVADVDLTKALVLSVGTVAGAGAANRFVRSIPDSLLRTAVVLIGCGTAAYLLLQ